MFKMTVQRGRSEFGRRGVQGKYVEVLMNLRLSGEAGHRRRTKLAAFFNILLKGLDDQLQMNPMILQISFTQPKTI
jgi:hypothetical protein